jgi:metal-responsive CopG/Arc/MetJ family transcriptional regulator
MAKKVIQVPFDAELLAELDRISKKERKARAELIRDACREHLHRIEREEMDRIYRESYEKVPESPEWGDLGAKMMAEVLKDEEPW